MWDGDELGFDEPTQVLDRDPYDSPPSGPIPLVRPIDDTLEIVEIVELRPRRALPPPRRHHKPAPPAPSLVEATPTRPGEVGYTNDLLFVEVTPPAFTIDAIIQPVDEPAPEHGDRTSVEPATFDLMMQPPQPRASWSLKLGAVAAVLLAFVSYLNGPIEEPEPPGRAAFKQRTKENATASAAEVVETDANKTKRPRRARRARAEVAVADAPAGSEELDGDATLEETEPEELAEATSEETSEDTSEEPSETEEELTEALAPEFNVSAAKSALAVAAANASACSGDGKTHGKARVGVTFARSGNATSAVIDAGSSLAGTGVGSCIARIMRKVTIPAYSGEVVTVRTRVIVKKRAEKKQDDDE